MKTVIIHGQNHKGSTYHIARQLAEKLGGDVTEFFLPKDFGEFCCGCTKCFIEGEDKCPHYQELSPVTEAIDSADVIILASPVYVYHVTGTMKALLDHYGYRWMPHRPDGAMFRKQGVCISTAAGAGMKSTNKDMADSLTFWGVARIYKFGIGIAATSWEQVSESKLRKIDSATSSIANTIKKNQGKVSPGLKPRMLFSIMRLFQKKGLNKLDAQHWEKNGWLGKDRPWK
ncbi:MAG: NAD(P)H-dependent oxidoreductase [Ruminococcus sp.]|nr:NAD(P)H-dependent oxidoreductase [Ruminococcus sp.]